MAKSLQAITSDAGAGAVKPSHDEPFLGQVRTGRPQIACRSSDAAIEGVARRRGLRLESTDRAIRLRTASWIAGDGVARPRRRFSGAPAVFPTCSRLGRSTAR